jgi:hypothetical protein
MNDATLERLMIDEALGALDADVSALLAAYTAKLPASSSERAAWQKLAGTVRQTMPVPALQTLPPLRISRLPEQHYWRAARATLALGAAVAIGIAIGLWRPHPAPTTVGALPPVAPSPATPAISLPPPPAGGQSFWSSQRLLAMAQGQKSEARIDSAKPSRAFSFDLFQSQPQGIQ